MRSSRVLVAATCVALATARPAVAAGPKPHAPAHASGNAEAEAMRKQMQHEQAQAEKLMRQQQQAMQQEMKRVQHQQAQMQAAAARQQAQAAVPGVIHHGTGYHHAGGYHTYYHRNHVAYRHHTRWPGSLDPETAALVRLKSSLDGVARGSTHTQHTAKLGAALGGVVEIDTPPTPAAVQALAAHLSRGMAHRQGGPVNTEVMSLALRAVMNSTILPRGELATVVKQHQAAIRSAHFQPGDINDIETAMEAVVTQERVRR